MEPEITGRHVSMPPDFIQPFAVSVLVGCEFKSDLFSLKLWDSVLITEIMCLVKVLSSVHAKGVV